MTRTNIAARLLAVGSAALAVSLTLFAPTSATARTPQPQQVVPSLGSWKSDHSDFVGVYLADVDGRWTKVYCIRPDNSLPTAVTLDTVDRLRGTTREVTRELAATLAMHGNAETAVQAAAVSQALNEELGNHSTVQRRAQWLPDRVQVLADRYVAQARALHGPYRLSIDLPRSPLPGRSARGTVTLESADGPAAGSVTLRHSANAMTPADVNIPRSGTASFTYETVAGGPVRIAAVAKVLPTTVRASSPAAGEQLMVSWTMPEKLTATATYEATGPGFRYRYACSSECDGHPVVTLGACAPASRFSSTITFALGDDAKRRIRFAAATRRQCDAIDVALADGTTVNAAWQFRTPAGGWTRKLESPTSVVVDCPAPPPVAVALSYECTQARVSATLGTLRFGALRRLFNRTSHRMVLEISGAVSGRYLVAPRTTAEVHTFRVACGSAASITLRSGVQRANGEYNYGDPVEVALP